MVKYFDMPIWHPLIPIILIIICFQVRAELGLADHVWQNKRAAIAQEVDGLGTQFRPALSDGCLKYIKATYAAQPKERERAHPLHRGRWSWTIIKDDFLLLLHPNDDDLLLHRLWKAWRRVSAMNNHPERRFCFGNHGYNS